VSYPLPDYPDCWIIMRSDAYGEANPYRVYTSEEAARLWCDSLNEGEAERNEGNEMAQAYANHFFVVLTGLDTTEM
jgi:hypothetical protein